jgi:hypothetical protein
VDGLTWPTWAWMNGRSKPAATMKLMYVRRNVWGCDMRTDGWLVASRPKLVRAL